MRKEGLEGYVEDFASMVREIWNVTGDIGIEVLPVVPVVFNGLDEEGGRLLSGVKEWIRWMGRESGRVELVHLSETAGREEGEQSGEAVFLKPVGMLLRSQRKESMELGSRGNVLTALKGERMELHLKEALPSKEISRLMGVVRGAGGGGREDEAERKRGSFGEGVSLEGEYAFTKGIEAFCKVAVREGRYKGTYLFNLKDQVWFFVLFHISSSFGM